jgi:hypothetical protein
VDSAMISEGGPCNFVKFGKRVGEDRGDDVVGVVLPLLLVLRA